VQELQPTRLNGDPVLCLRVKSFLTGVEGIENQWLDTPAPQRVWRMFWPDRSEVTCGWGWLLLVRIIYIQPR
jgi:hypothetical protein